MSPLDCPITSVSSCDYWDHIKVRLTKQLAMILKSSFLCIFMSWLSVILQKNSMRETCCYFSLCFCPSHSRLKMEHLASHMFLNTFKLLNWASWVNERVNTASLPGVFSKPLFEWPLEILATFPVPVFFFLTQVLCEVLVYIWKSKNHIHEYSFLVNDRVNCEGTPYMLSLFEREKNHHNIFT